MSEAITVDYAQCERLIAAYFRAGLVPMISGSPGIGKSAILRAIARMFNLKMIDLRLAQCDPTDLN